MAEQEQLLTFQGAGIPRPKPSDPRVIEAAIQKMAARLARELKKNGDDSNIEDIAGDLRKCMGWHCTDGFQLGKALDRQGWTIDADLVASLDLAWSDLSDAENELVFQWVKDTGVDPKLSEGAEVQFRHGKETYSGTIVGIHPKVAKYCVMIPDLGHVTEKEARQMKYGSATTGQLFPYEEVEAGLG